MFRSRTAISFAICTAILCAALEPPPPTKMEPVTDTLHGVKIVDPYRWLEQQDSPATRAWIEAQDRYARSYLHALPGRDPLRRKFESLAKIDTITAPTVRKGRYFYTRRLAAEDRSSLIFRQGLSGREELLVDPKTATDDPATSLTYIGISEDGNLIAYGTRRGGEDELNVRIVDVGTRKLLADSLPRARYTGFSFKPDNSGFYYGKFTNGVGTRIFYHAMGAASAADKEIFGNGYGPNQYTGVELSPDGRWLAIGVYEGVPTRSSEIWVQDLSRNTPIQRILKEPGEYGFEFAGNTLFVNTNGKAPNRKVLRIDLLKPGREHWKEVIPESPQTIERMWLAGGRVMVAYLENVQTRVKQFDAAGKYLGDLKLPGIGSVPSFSGRWDDAEAFYQFSSFVDPGTWYRFNVSSGKQDVWFRPKLPLDTSVLETRQVWFTSKDGTKVPMFLVHRKGIALDGSHPTLMTAYGGFAVSETPRFSNYAAWWAASGGVYALPNLRGGGEFGEKWHEAGMFERKQNVFDDFIAAGQWLFDNKYTRPANLAINGSSNGGLLMGAMITQRPDMFNAILCGAPLLDMLRYQKMLVGAWWVSEYGSADDPKQFPYLHNYSPYHNVRPATKFPAVLFYTGDADTRVDPSHARKMTALVQAANASENPILLRYDIKGGHSGQGSVNMQIDEQVDRWSFIASRVGLKIE